MASRGELTTSGRAKFTFIDLFAGIGGFHIGMKAAGGRCVFASEWDKHAAATYSAWTGETNVSTQDIRELDYEAVIPDHDVLLAGFPCQPFSLAGVSKKNFLGRPHGFDDERQGNLFFAICAIAEAKRPPIMLLENVKHLRSHDKGRTWQVIRQSLEALDYEVRWELIDARAWVPQHRERIFLACFDRRAFTASEVASFRFPVPPDDGPVLGDILEANAPDRRYMLSDALWTYLQNYARKHQSRGNGFGYSLGDTNGVSRTLSARYYKDGSEILIRQRGWRNPRKLTPSEAARLMGFDETYSRVVGLQGAFPQVVSDVQAYRQFGNSVCPYVVEAIGHELVRVLNRRRRRLRG